MTHLGTHEFGASTCPPGDRQLLGLVQYTLGAIWKWNADCIIMYKNGDWTIDSWDSPSITQPTKDEIKAEISNYQVELDKTFYKQQRVGLADGYPSITEILVFRING